MEENKAYKELKNIIASLERRLNAPEALHKQDFSAKAREIEDHTERCIHALRVRKQILIDQLELVCSQQDEPTSKDNENINVLLQHCQELLKAGSLLYTFKQPTAERIWQEAKSLELLPTDCKDVVGLISVNLPTDLLDLIAKYGEVTVQGDLSSKSSCQPLEHNQSPSSEELVISLRAQIELLQQKCYDLEVKLKKKENSGERYEVESEIDEEELEILRDENAELQELNAKLQETIKCLETDLNQKNQLCNSLKQQAESLSTKCKMSKEKNKAKLRSLNVHIEELNDKIINLRQLENKLTDIEEHSKRVTNKLKMLEKISNLKETEFQTLARAIGHETPSTISIFRELTDFSDHRYSSRHLDLVKLLYHQVTYWHVLEFENLSVLQTVVDNYNELILAHSHDLDILTHIFSGVSLLLYMLSKNKGDDMEEEIIVDPLIVSTKDTKKNRRSRSFGGFGSASVVPLMPTSQSCARELLAPFLEEMRTPDLRTSTNSLTPLIRCTPLSSSEEFLSQLKDIVGKCFGNLLTFVAEQIDLLLDKTILVENFAQKNLDELAMQPINSLLNEVLSTFQKNLVHITLSQQFFSQVFGRINGYLLNGVLLRQQFCTDAFGKHLMEQMESLQACIDEMGPIWVGDSTCLDGIKQIAVVLQYNNKNALADERIRKVTCPALNSHQLRHLLSMYSPGDFGKRVPITIIHAIGARAPLDTSPMLQDINSVHPLPIKVLHYFEVDDMLNSAPSPKIREFVEKSALSEAGMSRL